MVKIDIDVQGAVSLITNMKKEKAKKIIDSFDKEELVEFLLEENCEDGESQVESEKGDLNDEDF